IPPVLRPVSPSPTRLKSCAASNGTTVSPSTTQNSDTSGPSRKDSSSTGCPSSSSPAACARAESRSAVTTTPLPAARPSSLTTQDGSPAGGPNRSRAASNFAGLSTISLPAVRTPAASITSLANAFEPSMRAASLLGPKQAIPASRTASATPSTSGTSGPMTTRSARILWANATTSSPDVTSTWCWSANDAVPALPGAMASASTCGSPRNASSRACSRAPEPITRTRTERHFSLAMMRAGKRREEKPGKSSPVGDDGRRASVEGLTRVHLDRCVDIGLLVLAGALRRGLLPLRHHGVDRAIERRTQRKAEVVGEEDGHLLEFGLGEFSVEQRRVDLNLGEVAISDGRHRRQRNDALVAHRQSRSAPDRAEQVVDGQVEVCIALDIGHLPAVNLVHFLEALAA